MLSSPCDTLLKWEALASLADIQRAQGEAAEPGKHEPEGFPMRSLSLSQSSSLCLLQHIQLTGSRSSAEILSSKATSDSQAVLSRETELLSAAPQATDLLKFMSPD